jgi:CheY-like chemotaxis protein
MSGALCARALRASGYAGKIVGLTGDPRGCAERHEFEAAGLNAVLDKSADTIGFLRNMLADIAADYASGGAGAAPDRSGGSVDNDWRLGRRTSDTLRAEAGAVSTAPPSGAQQQAADVASRTHAPSSPALPALPPLVAALKPKPAAASKQLPLPAGFRVLYVEDDRVLQRSTVLRLFKPYGVPHDLACDGVEALALVVGEGRQYVLIVMDNQMPNMSGTICVRALRASGYTGKIVGLTGDPRGCVEREEFEAAGLDRALDKDARSVANVLQLIVEASVAARAGGEREPGGSGRAGGGESVPAPLSPASWHRLGSPGPSLADEVAEALLARSSHRLSPPANGSQAAAQLARARA